MTRSIKKVLSLLVHSLLGKRKPVTNPLGIMFVVSRDPSVGPFIAQV